MGNNNWDNFFQKRNISKTKFFCSKTKKFLKIIICKGFLKFLRILKKKKDLIKLIKLNNRL
jgi:hypothetical protein